MNHGIIKQKINSIGIIPVVKIEEIGDVEHIGKALLKGGLPIVEITFRTNTASEAIKQFRSNFPEMLVGAGTVLTKEQADSAISAGAHFIVSPGFNEKVICYCLDNDIMIIPGCITPTEIERALSMGLKLVKFFPAEASGGINMLKALEGPYPQMQFLPTGGINIDNMNTYLQLKSVIACGGSWMVSDDLIKSKDFKKVEILTKETVNNLLDIKIKKANNEVWNLE